MSLTFPVYACPSCGFILSAIAEDRLKCLQEETVYRREDNIWRFLSPDLNKKYARFIHEYEIVRKAEGRGFDQAGYYESLPSKDISGNFSEDWRIRAATYAAFLREALNPFHVTIGRALKVLDLGAGNGWLSNRLARLNHHVVALDLSTNRFDGLGSCTFYQKKFELVQAAFDYLPFPDGYFDLVIFNASLHYSEAYSSTLESALRVLNMKGRLVIMDSPIYQNAGSGDQMVKERESYFTAKFGFPSDAIQSQSYLTHAKITELGGRFGINWQYIKPYYGWKWRLKPVWSRLRGLREPAQFILLVGKRN